MGRSGQLLLSFVAALVLFGCAPPRATWVVGEARERPQRPATESRRDEPPIPVDGAGGHAADGPVHVVQPGETLYRIARRYGVDPDELADANEIADPTKLAVGRELVIPQRGQTTAAAPAARASGVASEPSRSPPRVQARTTVSRREPARTAGQDAILRWPLQGVLYSRFGPRGATRHDGIDIAAPEGTPIGAAADGVVIYAGVQRGYGNIVIVRHAGDLITIYAHNQKNLVKEGDEVKAGQPVARVGRTGRATGPHCHFEVRRGTTPHDPLDFLP